MGDRRLHIGVDGRELVGKPTGVGRYLGSVLREWRYDSASRHRVTVFLPAAPEPSLKRAHPGLEWVVDNTTRGGTAWEQTRLPRLLARAGIDAFLAAGYTAPLRSPCPFVVAIYDVSFFAHPEWFPWREGLRRRWLTKSAARHASSVVTISEFSAREIVKWLGIPRDRVRLAPPGSPPPKELPPAAARDPLVLFVGSLFTRRHIPDLLRGFAEAYRDVPQARLTLVGDNRTNPRIDPLAIATELGIRDRVEWHHYADDAELDRLYGAARVFAFLSDYEGFAMTPMEAIAAGAPAVLLDTAVAREVYADGAAFIDATPTRIGDTLKSLLIDDVAHAGLLAKGRARLHAFSWRDTAAVVLRSLEEAAIG